jgi:hypothetical protein
MLRAWARITGNEYPLEPVWEAERFRSDAFSLFLVAAVLLYFAFQVAPLVYAHRMMDDYYVIWFMPGAYAGVEGVRRIFLMLRSLQQAKKFVLDLQLFASCLTQESDIWRLNEIPKKEQVHLIASKLSSLVVKIDGGSEYPPHFCKILSATTRLATLDKDSWNRLLKESTTGK